MPNKRLSDSEIEELKGMVVNGASPEDLAAHFNIAISSVHNYKNRFKEQGVEFPSVKGKRPAGIIDMASAGTHKEIPGVVHSNGSHDHEHLRHDSGTPRDYTFIINGISVNIFGARIVDITHEKMVITY